MRTWERAWVAVVIILVGVPAIIGGPQIWPFLAWGMFAGPGPERTDAVTVIGVTAGGEELVRDDALLPGGFLREVYEPRWERLDGAGRNADCTRMLTALEGDGAVAVRVEDWSWDPVERSGDHPASVSREVLHRCGSS